MSLLDFAAPGVKFDAVGVRHGGTLLGDSREVQMRHIESGQLLYWQDAKKVESAADPATGRPNDPCWQLVVEFDSGLRDPEIEGDDGSRSFYIRGDMLRAVKEAKRRAGAARDKVLIEGASLYITFVREEPPAKRGMHPKKIYAAEYRLPVTSGVASGAATPTPAASEDAPPF